MTNLVDSRLSLRPREAAKSLGISTRTLWQLTHDGHIRCVRTGPGPRAGVLYPISALREWLGEAESRHLRQGDAK
jgi:excisionase family DNA binding protein